MVSTLVIYYDTDIRSGIVRPQDGTRNSGDHFMNASAVVADTSLDITSDVCPMTYVRTRLALDRMASGQILAVRLRGADPARNVPEAAIRQGHHVVSQHSADDDTTLLLLRRK